MFLARRQYLKHGVHHYFFNYILFVIIYLYIYIDMCCIVVFNFFFVLFIYGLFMSDSNK